MGNLSPRPGRSPSNRRKREQRAFTLTMVGGTAAAVTVVGFVLAIAGVLGWSVPVIAAIVAVVCALWFRGTVSGR
jgi:putative flippase GtrA